MSFEELRAKVASAKWNCPFRFRNSNFSLEKRPFRGKWVGLGFVFGVIGSFDCGFVWRPALDFEIRIVPNFFWEEGGFCFWGCFFREILGI